MSNSSLWTAAGLPLDEWLVRYASELTWCWGGSVVCLLLVGFWVALHMKRQVNVTRRGGMHTRHGEIPRQQPQHLPGVTLPRRSFSVFHCIAPAVAAADKTMDSRTVPKPAPPLPPSLLLGGRLPRGGGGGGGGCRMALLSPCCGGGGGSAPDCWAARNFQGANPSPSDAEDGGPAGGAGRDRYVLEPSGPGMR